MEVNLETKTIYACGDPMLELSIDDSRMNIVIKTVGGGRPDFVVMGCEVEPLIKHLQALAPHLKR